LNKEELSEHRERLQSLIAIAKKDEVMVDRIRRDPVGTLGELGVSRQILGDVLREEGYAELNADDWILTARQRTAVQMASFCDPCCATCIFTECPVTRIEPIDVGAVEQQE
jgi:hypothetical protein